MSVRRLPFRFCLPADQTIRGDVWLPEEAPDEGGDGAALVVCHGFKGFKDWGFFPWVCRELAGKTGRPTVGFDFTGAGVGEEGDRFDELDRFARNTFTRELRDLEAVLDRLAVGRLGEVVVPPARRFGLLGHSRGGATCVLKAGDRRQVGALVTWSAIASVERYEREYGPTWEAGRTVYIRNARTEQDMPLERNVLDDLRANRERLDVSAAAAAVAAPWLIVHGTEDESVPVEDARALAAASGGRAALLLVEGSGHTFGVGHPFEGPSPALERALGATAEHFRDALSGRREVG